MNLITNEEAKELQSRYNESRGNYIDEHLGYEDMRSVNFSIQELKDYIDYVEAESMDSTGIRIVLGAYDKNENGEEFTTMFLAATKNNGESFTDGAQPLNKGRSNKKPFDR